MNAETDLEPDKHLSNINIFVYLLFGLHRYLQSDKGISNSLRRALNTLSFEQPDRFPKTLHALVEWCHQPVSSWYPLPIPEHFNASQPILYDHRLSEEAQHFYLTLMEEMGLPPFSQEDVPQAALENYLVIELRQRLREHPNVEKAQHLYVQVRSFLIEHSWTTAQRLRSHSRNVRHELRVFYEDIPSFMPDTLVVCDRCGLLEWREEHWRGIKLSFCSDHGSGSPLVRSIRKTDNMLRLKGGIHLRTFLPGRLEHALFTFADHMQNRYPDHLLSVERYPGLDTYDLRLTFVDEVWAVDAKDRTMPGRLVAQIRPFYNEGVLSHTHAFYVIPDERMNDANYRDQLEQHTAGILSSHLHIASLSVFQQSVEEKLKTLTNPSRQNKGKKA